MNNMSTRGLPIAGLPIALVASFLISTIGLVGSVDAQRKDSKVWPGSNNSLDQVNEINRLIEASWKLDNVTPVQPAEDYEWCRRLYLDLLGRIPTVEEVNKFTKDKSPQKYARLVDRLLESDNYTEEYSRNWTTIWTNLLIGRTGGNANNSMINRAGMQKYLRDSFARNKPYDRLVRELVTATGSPSPDEEEFNGAVNFLIDKVNDENAAQATAATSRLFLGVQVQCTQCHNHPFNDWEQKQYWQMNAFFRQTRAVGGRRAQMMGNASRLVDRDFAGESNNVEEADLYYELRDARQKVAYPVFIDGTQISKHGAIGEVNRRKELADLIVESEYLEKALVNRIWAHFMGYGFTKPVDDLGPHNLPTHPELMDYLASELRKADFDYRQLIRWIVLSRPYGLTSKMPKAKRKDDRPTDDPQAGTPPYFSRFYLRQMRAEELYESLLVATRAEESAGSYEQQEQRKNRWLQQFAQAFGTDEGDETTSFAGTIPQVLMMFNGEMIRQATEGSGNFLDRVAKNTAMDSKQKVDFLFLSGLSRKANKKEMQIAQDFYAARGSNTVEALRDLWWVILNSNEFIFNH